MNDIIFWFWYLSIAGYTLCIIAYIIKHTLFSSKDEEEEYRKKKQWRKYKRRHK